MFNKYFKIQKLFIVIVILLTTSAFAVQPWTVEYTGKGPHLKIKRFILNPDSKQPLSNNRQLYSLSQSIEKNDIESAKQKEFEIGWGVFNDILNFGGQGFSFAEQALYMDGFSDINSGLSYLGLFLSVAQVGLDLSAGKYRDAAVNSYKPLLGYALGKLGTRAAQISSVGIFFIDYSITQFGKEAWLAREDSWRKAYVSYYKENLRTNYEWLEKIKEIYDRGEKSNKSEYFKSLLHYELHNYTSKFWREDPGNTVFQIADSGRILQGRSLTNEIKTNLENEYKAMLLHQFDQYVFPELGQYAWKKSAEKETSRMNHELKEEFNKTYNLEVRAYGLKGKGKILIQKEGKTIWQSTISSDKPFKGEITRIAYLKEAFPDHITLIDEKSKNTKTFRFKDGKSTVIFGTPEIHYLVKYKRKESERNCKVIKILKDGKRESRSVTLPAIEGSLYSAIVPAENVVIYGQYDIKNNKWTSSSIGHTIVKSQPASTGTMTDMINLTGKQGLNMGESTTEFYMPSFEGIKALKNCKGKTSSLLKTQMVCNVERFETKMRGSKLLMERICTSTMELETDQYFVLDGTMKGQNVNMDNLMLKGNIESINKGLKDLQKLQLKAIK